MFIIYLIHILETSCIRVIFLLRNYNGSMGNFLFFL
jgi:hypothetical protein